MKVKDIIREMEAPIQGKFGPGTVAGKKAEIVQPNGITTTVDLTNPENAAKFKPNAAGQLQFDQDPDPGTMGVPPAQSAGQTAPVAPITPGAPVNVISDEQAIGEEQHTDVGGDGTDQYIKQIEIPRDDDLDEDPELNRMKTLAGTPNPADAQDTLPDYASKASIEQLIANDPTIVDKQEVAAMIEYDANGDMDLRATMMKASQTMQDIVPQLTGMLDDILAKCIQLKASAEYAQATPQEKAELDNAIVSLQQSKTETSRTSMPTNSSPNTHIDEDPELNRIKHLSGMATEQMGTTENETKEQMIARLKKDMDLIGRAQYERWQKEQLANRAPVAPAPAPVAPAAPPEVQVSPDQIANHPQYKTWYNRFYQKELKDMPGASREAVDAWAKKYTDDAIKGLIQKGTIPGWVSNAFPDTQSSPVAPPDTQSSPVAPPARKAPQPVAPSERRGPSPRSLELLKKL